MVTLIIYSPEGISEITKYPSRLVAAPKTVLLRKTFAYDIGSPEDASLTNPLTDWLNNKLFEIIITNPSEIIHCFKFFLKEGRIMFCTIICDKFSIC